MAGWQIALASASYLALLFAIAFHADRRAAAGASVIAILRDGRAYPNPQPTDRIEGGDTLMVVGDREQVARFAAVCKAPAR